jgi:hypothetical protein
MCVTDYQYTYLLRAYKLIVIKDPTDKTGSEELQ